jgi:hypothetical protein
MWYSLGLSLLLFFLAACGIKVRDEKDKINSIKVSLTPAPGSYSFKPWVKMTRSGEDLTAVEFFVKAPEDADFKLAQNCYGTLYEAESYNSTLSACVKMGQSGTLSYYLKNSVAQSDIKTVNYEVSSVTHDITLESRSLPSDTPETLVLKELETTCVFAGTGLNIFITTSNVEKLTDKRYAYVILSLTQAEAGASTEITHENDWALGVDIKPTSDSAPGIATQATYKTSVVLRDTNGTRTTSPSCVVTATDAQRGGLTKGTFTCKELGGYADPEEQRFGPLISLSGSWQCDSFQL